MRKHIILALTIMLCGLCVMDFGLCTQYKKNKQYDNSSSIYALAGEFRTVFANMLWIKVEQYHHEYEKTNKSWTSNKDLLTLIDLIILLDPKFEEAYAVGAQMQVLEYKKPLRAIDYLEKGIRHCPKSYTLNKECALAYAYFMHDYKRSLPLAQKAVKYAPDDFERNLARKLTTSISNNLSQN